jgi:hypothetical protein
MSVVMCIKCNPQFLMAVKEARTAVDTRSVLTTAFSGSVMDRTDVRCFYDSVMGKLGNYKTAVKTGNLPLDG